jgi:hypothetical protein
MKVDKNLILELTEISMTLRGGLKEWQLQGVKVP